MVKISKTHTHTHTHTHTKHVEKDDTGKSYLVWKSVIPPKSVGCPCLSELKLFVNLVVQC